MYHSLYFQEFCDDLRTLPEAEVKDLALAVDIVTGEPEVKCFIDEMKEFYEVLIIRYHRIVCVLNSE